jgi:hypothetical protein
MYLCGGDKVRAEDGEAMRGHALEQRLPQAVVGAVLCRLKEKQRLVTVVRMLLQGVPPVTHLKGSKYS